MDGEVNFLVLMIMEMVLVMLVLMEACLPRRRRQRQHLLDLQSAWASELPSFLPLSLPYCSNQLFAYFGFAGAYYSQNTCLARSNPSDEGRAL